MESQEEPSEEPSTVERLAQKCLKQGIITRFEKDEEGRVTIERQRVLFRVSQNNAGEFLSSLLQRRR